MNRYTIGSGLRAVALHTGLNSSTFDPEMFMNQQTTDSNSTTYTPVPEKELQAYIKDVKAGTAGDKPVLNVTWATDDAEAREATGMDEPTVRQTIWLDLTPQGGLDMGKGKNVGLGKLREALGQNEPGQPWAPGMLFGQAAMISVKHRAGKDGEVFADVKAVAAL